MKDVLGISLGYNTSVAVVNAKEGIKLAISEERLNGVKNTKDFPINALMECAKVMEMPKKGELLVGISSYEVINDRTMRYFNEDAKSMRQQFPDFWSFLKEYLREILKVPKTVEIKIHRVEHHEAHNYPALYMSGYLLDKELKTISITYDGFGDGVCATIVDHSTNEILAREYIENSLGLVYQYVTGALGFKEHQHEGKITGLAAFGTPKYKEVFEDFFIGYDYESNSFIPNYLMRGMATNDFDVELNRNIHGFKNMLRLKERVYSFIQHLKENAKASDADIAATVQSYTEDLISTWIYRTLQENKIHNCNMVLSGGVFSNVKLNYAVKTMCNPENLFILPPMGDEGTSIGSAIGSIIWESGERKINKEVFAQDKLYLGMVEPKNELNDHVIDKKKYRVYRIGQNQKVRTSDDSQLSLSGLIGSYLAANKIVCISRGYSEFGPRALGNHSILYNADKKETNDSLNERLNRTEFMPFAPITINRFSEDLFKNTKGLEKTLKYMTISVPVTKEFEEGYKAAYHVDLTARPQVLHIGDNPIIYSAIEVYYNLSKKKALINTSFNLHNAPIIFDDVTAYESFVKADLDVLVLRDKLIVKRGQ